MFSKFEAPDYSEEGVSEFKKYIEHDATLKRFDSSVLTLGAFVDNTLVWVLEARTLTHISLMFVAEKYHGQGIARALFNEALSKMGNNDITVNSSPYAVEIYKKFGFAATDDERIENGIRYLHMTRKLF